MTPTFDFGIIGGGIVGLAVAERLGRENPNTTIVLIEKEKTLGAHQSGHNSGVIHSGIYYKPGSLKAKLARDGNASMVEFCRAHGIAHEVCGKVIAAVTEEELPRLADLERRASENGIAVARLDPQAASELEPHLRCLAALHVPSTGIADFPAVCRQLGDIVRSRGGEILLDAEVTRLRATTAGHLIETRRGSLEVGTLITCAGLQSDRVARLDGVEPHARIVPFRGEYREVRPERRNLVRNLIYPVPNPEFPFLGVHFTRTIDGSVHVGPNAVLALAREGYRKTDLNPRDLAEILGYPAFWKMARRNMREGLKEIRRSLSRHRFAESARALVPELRDDDLVPGGSGVRAQALRDDGALVDDFLIVEGKGALHVCNAPSPAATAALEIAKEIVARIHPAAAPAG